MGNRIARRFAKKRDALIVQREITAAEFAALRNMLHPGMTVRNFVSGNTATVRAVCTEPGKPVFGYITAPILPVNREIIKGRRAGKVEETHWFLLNVDVA